VIGQALRLRIVRSPDQHNMQESHARQERDQAEQCDLVLAKELLGPNVATADSGEDDDGGEAGAPPANQQGRPVLNSGARSGSRGIDGHGEWQPRSSNPVKGRASSVERLRSGGIAQKQSCQRGW
jgi:hypothetical protein